MAVAQIPVPVRRCVTSTASPHSNGNAVPMAVKRHRNAPSPNPSCTTNNPASSVAGRCSAGHDTRGADGSRLTIRVGRADRRGNRSYTR